VNKLDYPPSSCTFVFGFKPWQFISLIALALVTTSYITGVLNLAQGEFVALGALLAASLYAQACPWQLHSWFR
jgi:branched-subunit amino acid ABC-type transport system permease component